MKSKHTPGPWRVLNDRSTVEIGGQATIVGPAPDGAPREQEIANAHLISAAPEMLLALERIARVCIDGAGATIRPHADDIYVVREAIRKAQGKPPAHQSDRLGFCPACDEFGYPAKCPARRARA